MLQEGEISAEMMTFHEAVSHLQQLEEDLLETHKSVQDSHQVWKQKHHQLLNMTRDVDYDQDGTTLYWAKNIVTFTFLPLLYTIIFLWVNTGSKSSGIASEALNSEEL